MEWLQVYVDGQTGNSRADPFHFTHSPVGSTRFHSQGYEGDFQWVIELEKGWSPFMPGNEPYYGATDAPLKYTLGRYDFEARGSRACWSLFFCR